MKDKIETKSRNSMLSNVVYNIIYNLINIFFPLITSIYVSRILMDDGMGIVAFAQNITSYFVTVASVGLPVYGVQAIAKVRNDKIELNQTFTQLFIANCITTSVSVFLYFLMISKVASFYSDFALYFCSGLLLIFNYINIDWFYRGCEEYRYIAFRSMVIKIVSLVFLLLLVREKSDYIIYTAITSIASGGNYVWNVIHARRYVKFDFTRFSLRKHSIPLLVLGVSSFLSSAYNKIDTTMLGMLSTNSAVGYYTNAHKMINLIITCCNAISGAFLPRISSYWENDRERFLRLVNKGIEVLVFISFPAAIGVFIIAPDIVVLFFGDAFSPASLTVRIFSVLVIVRSLGDLLCYQVVICTRNEKKRLPADLTTVIINIVLNSIFIPLWSQNGAAFASLISELFVNSFLFWKIRKIVYLRIKSRVLICSFINSFLMGIIAFVIGYFIPGELLGVFSSIVIGVLFYMILSYIEKVDVAVTGWKYMNLMISKVFGLRKNRDKEYGK